MGIVESKKFSLILATLRITGISMLIIGGIIFLLGLIGSVSFDRLAIGESSGIRTVASIAVLGCLLAAVGHCDDFNRD